MNLLLRPNGDKTLEKTDSIMSINASANEIVERSFHAFLAELFLYALPKATVYYPRQRIIGCNVERLLATLSGSSKAMCSTLVECPSFLDLLRRHGIALDIENS